MSNVRKRMRIIIEVEGPAQTFNRSEFNDVVSKAIMDLEVYLPGKLVYIATEHAEGPPYERASIMGADQTAA